MTTEIVRPEPGTLPGRAVPYVLKAGEGKCHLVAGQIIHTLAGTHETGGGYGVVTCRAGRDRRAIPLHWHAREHDTWLCIRGSVEVWSQDRSHVLLPGEFAYVRPGDKHSYQSRSSDTFFLGVVAPGGWEEFFDEAGEVWNSTELPPPDRPFDFARLGRAIGKYGVMVVENQFYCEPAPDAVLDKPPGAPQSYYLAAGSRAIISGAESSGTVGMRLVEAADGAAYLHREAHEFIYVLDGHLRLVLGDQTELLGPGDGANIPANAPRALTAVDGPARYVSTVSGGGGESDVVFL